MSGKFDMTNNDCYRAALEIGADFFRSLTLVDECTREVRDLTGYSSKLQVRATPGSTVLLTPAMVVKPTEGVIEAFSPAATTATLTAGMYYYDWIIGKPGVLITDPWSAVERILEGKFQFSSRITI